MSMLRKRKVIIVICLIAVMVATGAFSAFSQPYARPENSGNSILKLPMKQVVNFKKMSLLDPDRFKMKHQYMMSFSSTGGSGNMMGMYLNTMEYRFNMPLIMRVRVAYQSQSAQLFGNKSSYSGQPNIDQGRVFMPSFDLVYQPTKNTTIGFFYRDYSSMNPSYNPYSPFSSYGYGSRYNRYRNPYFMGY